MFWKAKSSVLRVGAAPWVMVVVLAASLAVSTARAAMSATQALNGLRTAGAKAQKDCDASEDEGIQKAREKASNLKENQQSDQASNPMRACQDMQGASDDAAKSMTAFKTRCESVVKTCADALEALGSANLGARDKEFKEACEKLKTDMSNLESEIGKSTMQAKSSQQCQQDIGGGQMPQLPQMPTSSPSPSPTPKTKELKQDCNNPSFAATNPVCVCGTNPWAVGCGTDQSPSVEAMINDSSQAVSSNDFTSSGGGASAPRVAHETGRLGRYQGQGGGGGGGGVGGSSSPGSSGRDNPKGDAMVRIPASGVGKGGAGRGAAGGEGGGGGARGSGGGYREDDAKAGGRRPGSLKNDAAGADLKKFLPDGMTGPHSNLFHNVRVRYRAKTPTLDP